MFYRRLKCTLAIKMGLDPVEEGVVNSSKLLSDYIIRVRRDIHSYPELRYEECGTSKLVEEELVCLGFQVARAAGTGVIGVLRVSEERALALRAGIDALPIQEENDAPYKSRGSEEDARLWS
ncbi:MAG: hypothetical protein QW740_05810 [Sulfolobales archaeon]